MTRSKPIFPLASLRETRQFSRQPKRDAWPWSVNSPLGQSGDTSGTSLRTKGFAVPTPSCTGARAVPAMPNTRSAIAGFGAQSRRSGNGFRTAAWRPRPCAPIVPSMPIGRTSTPTRLAGAARANAAKAARDAAWETPATAPRLAGVSSPYLPSAWLDQPMRSPRPTRSAPLLRAARTGAEGSIARCRLAMAPVAAVIAAPPAARGTRLRLNLGATAAKAFCKVRR